MNGLEEFDAAFGVTAPVAPLPTGPPLVHNGTYTITFPDGSWRTFRIFTKKATAKFAPGKRVIAMLIGPINTTDYEGVSFLEDDGPKVWKRFRGTKVEKYVELLFLMAQGCEADDHTLSVSRTCLRCNRLLTTPQAISRGYGDHCWELIGG